MKCVIWGSTIKWFSCNCLVQGGWVQTCAQLWSLMLVKLFLVDSLKAVNPWGGKVNMLENASRFYLCNLLFECSLQVHRHWSTTFILWENTWIYFYVEGFILKFSQLGNITLGCVQFLCSLHLVMAFA